MTQLKNAPHMTRAAIDALFDPALLNKYNVNGPRYTSYPTALSFSPDISSHLVEQAAETSKTNGLSLYIHIPFCHSLCYYCGCNKIISRNNEKADRYLDFLAKEVAQRASAYAHYNVKQLHLGGGSPSFLSLEQQARLLLILKQHFRFADTLEASIEIDPRTVDQNYLTGLRGMGYNRLSIGVQDIDETVQIAINRVQQTSHIQALVSHAKTLRFRSVNLDLIYGLPHQTLDSFNATIDAVLQMDPQRISLFSYAHLPERFAAQRKIKDEWLPQAATKLQLMKCAVERLSAAGFELIGMDHFAKPDDELAKAQNNHTLHRNFQGYTTDGDLDLLGLGVSSISSVNGVYGQNPKTLSDYYAAIEGTHGLTDKGYTLTDDDRIRRHLIQDLMCNLELDIERFERTHQIDFKKYFSESLQKLSALESDGLVSVSADKIIVAPHARLLIRIICMCFDAYLGSAAIHQRYSRVI